MRRSAKNLAASPLISPGAVTSWPTALDLRGKYYMVNGKPYRDPYANDPYPKPK